MSINWYRINWYTGKKTSRISRNEVCAISTYSIYFMSRFIDENKLYDYKYAFVGNDVDTGNIIVKFTNNYVNGALAYTISLHKNNKGLSVSCRSFILDNYNFTNHRVRRTIEVIKETHNGNIDELLVEVKVVDGDYKNVKGRG